MSGIIGLQPSGFITLFLLQAVIIGFWVVVTNGVKIGRLERRIGGSSPQETELRKLGLWLADVHRKQMARTVNLAETVADVESTTKQLETRLRSIDRRVDQLHQDVTKRLDQGEADVEELRMLHKLLEALPETVADRIEKADHRHNLRRPSRGRPTRRPAEGRDDDPLSFVQPA